MLLNAIHNSVQETVRRIDGRFFVSKRSNTNFESSFDPLTGEKITINRYDTLVSASWVTEWISSRGVKLNKEDRATLNSLKWKEDETIDLTKCMINKDTRSYFSSILMTSNEKYLIQLKHVLTHINSFGMFFDMENHGIFYLISPCLRFKKEIRKGTYENGCAMSFEPGKKMFKSNDGFLDDLYRKVSLFAKELGLTPDSTTQEQSSRK